MQNQTIDRRLITILLIVFVQIVGMSLILPILPLYAQRDFQMSPATISLLLASFFVAQFIAGPILGRLSDKYGRLPVLIISQIGTAISFAMLGLAQSVTMLFMARILDGITGGNIIVAQAYITDITPKENRTQSLGLVFAAFGVGFAIGPALGGFLSAMFGSQVPFFIAALVAASVVVLTWFTLDETLSPEQRESNRLAKKVGISPAELLQNVPLMLILSIVFVSQFVMGVVQSVFALYGEAVLFIAYDVSLTNLGIGLLLTVMGISQLFTQLFLLKRAIARFNESQLVIIGIIIRSVALFLFAVITSPWLGVIPSMVFAVGMGLMMPSLQSLSTTTVSDQARGGVLGIYQSTMSLATIFGNGLGGFLFVISPATPFWFTVGIGLLTIIPAVILWRRIQHDQLSIVVEPST